MILINKTDLLKKSFSDYPLKRVTCDGYPLVIKDAVPGYLKNYTIYGSEGGVGDLVTDENDENYGKYKISIVNSGKNLITAQEVYKGANDYKEVIKDGRNCIRFIDNLGFEFNNMKFKEKTQYTVSFECMITTRAMNNALKSMFFRFFYTDGSTDNANIIYVEDNQKDKWISVKLTSTKGKTISAIGISACNFVHYCYIDVNTFQFEEGMDVTRYEKYRNPKTMQFFVDKPLYIFETFSFHKDGFINLELYDGTNIIECTNEYIPVKFVCSYNKYTKRESLW